jgi:hypothetical protein
VVSLYFSLLAGNWGREEFARGCAHRHTVLGFFSVAVIFFRMAHLPAKMGELCMDQLSPLILKGGISLQGRLFL